MSKYMILYVQRQFCRLQLYDYKGVKLMQQVKPPKKPLIFYYCIVLVIMILLNTLLFPSIL